MIGFALDMLNEQIFKPPLFEDMKVAQDFRPHLLFSSLKWRLHEKIYIFAAYVLIFCGPLQFAL